MLNIFTMRSLGISRKKKMSKHQKCPRCGFDFVGPDYDIGENLCPECEDEIIEGIIVETDLEDYA